MNLSSPDTASGGLDSPNQPASTDNMCVPKDAGPNYWQIIDHLGSLGAIHPRSLHLFSAWWQATLDFFCHQPKPV